MKKVFVTLSICVIACYAGGIQDFDNSLYDQIHYRWQCDFNDIYFTNVTYLGDGEVYLSVNLGLLIFGNESMKESAKLATAGLAATMLCSQLLKCAVGRDRPGETDTPRCTSSFPSGHTTAAFTMACVYGEQYPKLRIPLYLLAVSVGISRIYLGEHYPTDVIAGALLGTAGGIVIIKNKNFILELGM